MSTLLVVLCVALFVALVALSAAFRRLRRSIPILVEDEREAAIKEFKKRSGRTRVGTTVEQLVPYVSELPFDPSDMRILSGGPVDFVVFDGLCEGNVRELVFLDVKTGRRRRTSTEQKQVQ